MFAAMAAEFDAEEEAKAKAAAAEGACPCTRGCVLTQRALNEAQRSATPPPDASARVPLC